MIRKLLPVLYGVLLTTAPLIAQDSFYSKWEARANAIQAKQPAFPVPIVSADSGLVQLFRTDVVRQILPAGHPQWIYGNSKGVDLIPWKNTEIDINVPPYLQHHSSTSQDGFGDLSMAYKYRFVSGNAEHGNFVVSGSLAASVPTGSHKNGSTEAVLTPTIYAAKGWKNLYLQSNLGSTLPLANARTIGRNVVWNTVLQDHVRRLLYPELEVNSTYFHGGSNDGKSQVFLTPGLMVSKFKLQPSHENRLGILFGAGFQIATSHYHSYNHATVLSTRITF